MNYFIKSIKQFKKLYIFLFNYKANKLNIKKEIEKRYHVSVKTVRTMVLFLKRKKKYKKIKKVLIELKENQSIDL